MFVCSGSLFMFVCSGSLFMFVCSGSLFMFVCSGSLFMFVCMYKCKYVCMYECMHAYIRVRPHPHPLLTYSKPPASMLPHTLHYCQLFIKVCVFALENVSSQVHIFCLSNVCMHTYLTFAPHPPHPFPTNTPLRREES